jgi:3'-5' exoribonuclease
MFKKEEEDFAENIDSRRRIRSQFVVVDKIIKRGSSSGRKYIDVNLTDKTGDIVGRIFPEENIEDKFETITPGKIYRIIGNANEFPQGSGRYNIIINVIKELTEEDYDMDDFIKTFNRNKDEMIAEIKNTIKEIKNEDLKRLLDAFFNDKKFTEEFYTAPSAKIHHHNYVGGLLEHTAEVLKICKVTSEIFPELDKDLLFTGAILHDIGKMKTYDYDLISINFSEEGKLLDHLFISCDMVKDKINELEISEELSNKLLHIILSHHGDVKNGWGSPVNPKTPEAVAVHHADNLDAKVKGMLQNV